MIFKKMLKNLITINFFIFLILFSSSSLANSEFELWINDFKKKAISSGISKIVVEDACKWKPKNLLDAVLIDAPCSSTGTLRRNPDIFYTKTKRDIEKLTGIQLTLLKAAKSMVKKGGIIVFSTCSLLPQEGEDLIDSVLVEDKTLSRAPISAEELGLMPELVTKVGDLRTLPVHYSNLGGMDGFYAARLIRN